MTAVSILSFAYAFACTGVIAFQVALIFGAPWGRITQGGRFEGALPLSGRVGAAVSIFLVAAKALAILSAAGIWPDWPIWTGWAALALQAVVTVLNWITPSAAERRIWAPITSLMFILAAMVIILR